MTNGGGGGYSAEGACGAEAEGVSHECFRYILHSVVCWADEA